MECSHLQVQCLLQCEDDKALKLIAVPEADRRRMNMIRGALRTLKTLCRVCYVMLIRQITVLITSVI